MSDDNNQMNDQGMEKVGFIGLGIMGKPMALNLIRAGYPVVVLSRNKEAPELVAAGAQPMATANELAQVCDVVITMLPDSPDVEQVVLGPEGLLDGFRSGSLFIDMSTIDPAMARQIQERLAATGVDALDAPVSGGQVGAQEATLSIMAGGSEAAFQRALPLFQAMGKNIVHIGGPGAGQTTKACNQLIVGVTIQAVAEAFALAEKAGVDAAKMREVLLGGFAQSRILDLHGQRMIDKNFVPGGKIKFHLKDMGVVRRISDAVALSLPAAALVEAQMKTAVDRGNGDLDHSSLFLLLDQ